MKKYLAFIILFLSLLISISNLVVSITIANDAGNDNENEINDNNNNNNNNSINDNNNEQKEILPTSIQVLNAKNEIEVGESFSFIVDILPSDAANKTYEIVAYPDNIVEINGNTVTGKSYGNATILVKSKATASVVNQFNVSVKYNDKQSGLTISSIKTNMIVDETATFKVAYNGSEFGDISCITLPEGIVEINGNTIKAIKPGTTKLVIFKNGNYNEKVEVDINVYQNDFEVFGINEYMSLNEKSNLDVLLVGTLISSKDYVITISNNEVLKIENGVVTALNLGTTDVTISLKDYPNKSITITVRVLTDASKRPESIEVTNAKQVMSIEEENTLDILFYPLNTSSQEFKIYSTDKDMILVNGNKLKAVKEGNTFVVIESIIDPSVKYIYPLIIYTDYSINVTNVPSKIYINDLDHYINVEITSAFGINNEYKFTYSESGIIEILSNGKIVPLKAGTVTVTVALTKYPTIYKQFEIVVIEPITCSENPNQDKCLDPATWDWKYNRFEYDGKGAIIKLLHGTPEEIDPNSSYYTGTRRLEKQLQIHNIETAYNIDLVIERYPDSAAWGPDRVAWINGLAQTNTTDKGDIFAINSDWVPTLVEGKSIALLETVKLNSSTKQYDQKGGMFSDLNYTQTQEKIKQYKIGNSVYGYSAGESHADFFLYYNQDLINEYNLEDPATLWNNGEWDWDKFMELLRTAQTAFGPAEESGMYAFGGWVNEVARGALAARGGKFVDLEAELVLFTNRTVIQMCEDLRTIKREGMWASATNDVCPGFSAGTQLFQPGYLWFLSSTMRFASADPNNPTCDFEISVVPYPTATGDGMAKDSYTIPMGSDGCYAIRDISSATNGLTAEILLNILDDFTRGIAPEYSKKEMTDEEVYRLSLKKYITSEQSIKAIMSVENNLSDYGYTDYLEVVSASLGNGSHFQGEGFYILGFELLDLEKDVATILASHQASYQDKLEELID